MKPCRTTFPGLLAVLAVAMMPVLGLPRRRVPSRSSSACSVWRIELAIQRVLVEYSARQDARDYAGYAALFAKNGEWVNGKNAYKGREAIHKMLVDLYGNPRRGLRQQRELSHQPRISRSM